jgi:hypothetical protein
MEIIELVNLLDVATTPAQELTAAAECLKLAADRLTRASMLASRGGDHNVCRLASSLDEQIDEMIREIEHLNK